MIGDGNVNLMLRANGLRWESSVVSVIDQEKHSNIVLIDAAIATLFEHHNLLLGRYSSKRYFDICRIWPDRGWHYSEQTKTGIVELTSHSEEVKFDVNY